MIFGPREHSVILDSTHREAVRRAHMPGCESVIITCDIQSAGIGTHGRMWHCADGNLFASCVCRYTLAPNDIGMLSLICAISVFEALVMYRASPNSSLSLKWPNDVMCDGKKVAGVLLERVEEFIVISLGVNLSSVPTSVSEIGGVVRCYASREEVLDAITSNITKWCDVYTNDGFEKIRWFWFSHMHRYYDIMDADGKEHYSPVGRLYLKTTTELRGCSLVDIDALGRAIFLLDNGEYAAISSSEALVYK